MTTQEIIEALHWRYAVKVFDPTKKITEENLRTILEVGRLAPSSSGVEPWNFIVVKNPELRQKLRAVSYDQPKVTDAVYIIVIAHRTDAENLPHELVQRTAKAQGREESELEGLKKMAEGSVNKPNPDVLQGWLAAQTYIPLGMMIEAAALMGIDAGPMEGFQPDKVDELLDLKSKNLHATTMLALGHRGDDKYAKLPKTRRAFEEVVIMME